MVLKMFIELRVNFEQQSTLDHKCSGQVERPGQIFWFDSMDFGSAPNLENSAVKVCCIFHF